VLQALALELLSCCGTAIEATSLVPVPGWKRSGGNPLPLALATALVAGHPGRLSLAADLLQRRRASVGQHHLDRDQRLENLSGAFACGSPARSSPGQGLWLVDDILTTGATAQAAAAALVSAGWQVDGLLCLARTASAAGL
jgi:predicted amidophosphoribosyltransferase